ncbi:Uu.00g063420.m01.CDS01 [Anthostomella pinea]|uniref:Uu.00g063420.m01.CDS01 n=1 Tax=Anthostomella pinea TaxID=933095 RepID=A0AAI8VTC2_9PEZI|nr:Uu.00g063420.m01.CDS01 [Anthostomella pinea]
MSGSAEFDWLTSENTTEFDFTRCFRLPARPPSPHTIHCHRHFTKCNHCRMTRYAVSFALEANAHHDATAAAFENGISPVRQQASYERRIAVPGAPRGTTKQVTIKCPATRMLPVRPAASFRLDGRRKRSIASSLATDPTGTLYLQTEAAMSGPQPKRSPFSIGRNRDLGPTRFVPVPVASLVVLPQPVPRPAQQPEVKNNMQPERGIAETVWATVNGTLNGTAGLWRAGTRFFTSVRANHQANQAARVAQPVQPVIQPNVQPIVPVELPDAQDEQADTPTTKRRKTEHDDANTGVDDLGLPIGFGQEDLHESPVQDLGEDYGDPMDIDSESETDESLISNIGIGSGQQMDVDAMDIDDTAELAEEMTYTPREPLPGSHRRAVARAFKHLRPSFAPLPPATTPLPPATTSPAASPSAILAATATIREHTSPPFSSSKWFECHGDRSLPDFPAQPLPNDAKIRELERQKAERKRIEEEADARAEAERQEAVARAEAERQATLLRGIGLRKPKCTLITKLSPEWEQKAIAAPKKGKFDGRDVHPDGVALHAEEFERLVGRESNWLNDDCIHASLVCLAASINQAAGIRTRNSTPKCVAISSLYWEGFSGDQGKLFPRPFSRNWGMTPKNFLEIDTILIPINHNAHWTLLVIRPTRRTVAYVDSFHSAGRHQMTLAYKWLELFLGDRYVANDWKDARYSVPSQTNGHDCGMFVITNAIYLALGLDPNSYSQKDMPLQRKRIAAMLLNKGFHGAFDLSKL